MKNFKGKIAATFAALFIGMQASNAAIVLFPVGLLVYLSPTCDYQPTLCLVLEEDSYDTAIQKTVADKYPWLDEMAVKDLSLLISEEVDATNSAPLLENGQKVSISLPKDRLINEILAPSGALDFHPEKSFDLVQDFR